MLNYRFRLNPTSAQQQRLAWTLDTCRQVYNHFLHRLNRVTGTSSYSEQKRLPELKEWWTDLQEVHSKVLQKVVQRLYDNLSTLKGLKENGHCVGELKWKGKGYYHSFEYSQSGFKLNQTSGRDSDELYLSKIGRIPVVAHRNQPDGAEVKTVTIKREPTGKWYAILSVETSADPPEKPENPEQCVGIDLGIMKFVHDTDGTAVGSLDLSRERERLEHEQHVLSRKEHGSTNWEKQRKKVARRHADLKRKRSDFLHKLSNYYAREYDLVAVEDLDAKGLLELDGNSRNSGSAAWGTFRRMLKYKCEREGTHFVAVEPAGTTKECARCGAETDKPLWVREHSCPACGFTANRDENAAWNVLQRGIENLDIGTGSAELTPAETVVPTATTVQPVAANHVAETGSPVLKREPSGER